MTTTVFAQSNKDFLGSLAHDVNALLDRWQSAADNGYGLHKNWGKTTDLIVDGVDLFSRKVLRNLVAITAFTAMVIIYGATLLYQWWQSQGASYCLTLLQGAAVAAVCGGVTLCVLLGGAFGVSCVVWRWLRGVVVPAVLRGLDRGLALIFCLGE